MSTKSITGIVLAGGRCSRMGIDKSMMKLKDKWLVEYDPEWKSAEVAYSF